ncbi:CoA-disulfide reductase [Paraoerskovia sediminicola]|uniref:CoA-disulfide reductase n=1 Tax=Paraoerskovia sediminicola TaxID=1138587 RepID=A0ABM8G1W6_9CELL|nr:FAD-dependent oxidoreductase [Paraoerskovia sediminicola]BDZ42043.1 CoA-disulfide reductase [Paraoerskovia sediminicola]
MKIVIVGGVAAGMSAATRLRRLSEDAEIVVLEAGPHVSFANCGLPYYAGGVIEERDALLLQSPESLAARFGLDVRVLSRVSSVDTAGRTVTVQGPDGVAYVESYDELVLSPGARPVVPNVPGSERMHVLRDVTDVDGLVTAIRGARTAVVVGAGFIGVEVAENLVRRGLAVTLVELGDQVLAPLDPELAVRVQDRLESNGVAVRVGAQVVAVGEQHVELADTQGTSLGDVDADLVLAAIGVVPETALARDAGIAVADGSTGARGGVLVDADLRTSAPHVYAVGDAAVKRDALAAPHRTDVPGDATTTGWVPPSDTVLIPLANLANRHGRHVADVIMGRRSGHRPAQGTAIVGVFGLTAASTGRSEKRLRAEGRDHRVVHTHPVQHAGYYPGAVPMALKLLIDPATDAILGAQGVGEDGVDKRIDVIATAMAGGLTASDLMDLELAYAPAYGSAKDPVNMLGYVADNLVTGTVRTVQWHELDALDGALVVDVRTPAEHSRGTVRTAAGPALNLPLDELRSRHGEIPPGARVVVHCQVGQRGHTAARLLTELGHDVVNLDGGYLTWRDGARAVRSPVPAA